MEASLISRMKATEDENRRLKRMYADVSTQAGLLKEALGSEIMNATGPRECTLAIHGLIGLLARADVRKIAGQAANSNTAPKAEIS